jgi:hypothetical protein
MPMQITFDDVLAERVRKIAEREDLHAAKVYQQDEKLPRKAAKLLELERYIAEQDSGIHSENS